MNAEGPADNAEVVREYLRLMPALPAPVAMAFDLVVAEVEQLRAALKKATWDLACCTFIGKDISLGEEADRLYAEYASEAVRG